MKRLQTTYFDWVDFLKYISLFEPKVYDGKFGDFYDLEICECYLSLSDFYDSAMFVVVVDAAVDFALHYNSEFRLAHSLHHA